jgi:hypothetical protein
MSSGLRLRATYDNQGTAFFHFSAVFSHLHTFSRRTDIEPTSNCPKSGFRPGFISWCRAEQKKTRGACDMMEVILVLAVVFGVKAVVDEVYDYPYQPWRRALRRWSSGVETDRTEIVGASVVIADAGPENIFEHTLAIEEEAMKTKNG